MDTRRIKRIVIIVINYVYKTRALRSNVLYLKSCKSIKNAFQLWNARRYYRSCDQRSAVRTNEISVKSFTTLRDIHTYMLKYRKRSGWTRFEFARCSPIVIVPRSFRTERYRSTQQVFHYPLNSPTVECTS
jgi:hypothetical protein